jgi:CRP-like cAMP-binding protein
MFDELSGLTKKEITLKRNQFLTVKGNVDTNIYHIVSGTLLVFVLDNFEEQNIRFGNSGNLITVLDSF